MPTYWYEKDGFGRTVTVVTVGIKYDHALAVKADGLIVLKIPRGAKLHPLFTKGGIRYSEKRAIRHYRRIARGPGTTKAAKTLLKRLQRLQSKDATR